MNPSGSDLTSTVSVPIELQQPLPVTSLPVNLLPIVPRTEVTMDELPDLTDKLPAEPEHSDKYTDAMEHIIDKILLDTQPPGLKVSDATDSICATPVLVETESVSNAEHVLVTLQVDQQLKTCSVKLSRIDSILTYVPQHNLCATLMHDGKPHTRSRCNPRPPRRGRLPRTASPAVNYKVPDSTSDEEVITRKSRTRLKSKPGVAGPSNERIHSQNNKTVHPRQRLLPIKSDTPVTSSDDDADSEATELYTLDSDQETSTAVKGTKISKSAFRITVKGLRKTKQYRCKYCDKSFDSSKGLTEHHQEKHKIMCCKTCNRDFKNPTTYSRHLKTHSGSSQVCSVCSKAFAYASQLKTHQSVHASKRHKCTRTSCDHSFKNLGDLTRHLKLHDSRVHQCTECDYSHVDIRNLESHHLSHSRISKYICKNCGQGFIFNAQYQRHVNTDKCKYKRSASPEY